MSGKQIKCIIGIFILCIVNKETEKVFGMKKSSEKIIFFDAIKQWHAKISVTKFFYVSLTGTILLTWKHHINRCVFGLFHWEFISEAIKIRMWKLSHDFTIIPWLIALWWLPIFHFQSPFFPPFFDINIYYYMNCCTGHWWPTRMLFIIYMRLTSHFSLSPLLMIEPQLINLMNTSYCHLLKHTYVRKLFQFAKFIIR